MPLLVTALGLSLLGSFGGLLVASTLLLFNESLRTRIVPWLVSYAVGALLGASLLGLIPEALSELSPQQVLGSLLAGIVVFFILEKLVLLRHCHTDDCHVHGAAAQLVILGDAFHNFIDGAIIAAAVMTSVPLGLNTAIAIAAHEIPQEVGDFAILLHSGYSRRRALILNLASAAAGVAGSLLGFAAVSVLPSIRPFVLAFSSASMLYIAMSDLIPDLHRGTVDRNSLRQVLLIAAGIGTVVVFERFVH
ncbi:MAG: ZIP family metal transporter [Acidobacteria bacterium]|nr:ZIP family metal transporter [Acidobacteriota bacterium]